MTVRTLFLALLVLVGMRWIARHEAYTALAQFTDGFTGELER